MVAALTQAIMPTLAAAATAIAMVTSRSF